MLRHRPGSQIPAPTVPFELQGGAPSALIVGLREEIERETGLDRSMLAYLSNLGDTQKAADYLGVKKEILEKQVELHGWKEKLKKLLQVRDQKGQAEFAREINRLMNLTQAVRIRALIDCLLKRVTKDDLSMEDLITVKAKHGNNISFRALAELTKAMQICHQITYAALGDQTSERLFDKDVAVKKGEGIEEESSLAVFRTLTQLAHGTHPTDSPAPPLAQGPADPSGLDSGEAEAVDPV